MCREAERRKMCVRNLWKSTRVCPEGAVHVWRIVACAWTLECRVWGAGRKERNAHVICKGPRAGLPGGL